MNWKSVERDGMPKENKIPWNKRLFALLTDDGIREELYKWLPEKKHFGTYRWIWLHSKYKTHYLEITPPEEG